jgi:hypothetical protein
VENQVDNFSGHRRRDGETMGNPMNINQLTETNPIELARAVLTADDVKDFPIIHYAASQLLNALVTFEVEASYFEYEDGEE